MARSANKAKIIDVVAANVRAARKAAGLSQEKLALTADVDRTYVSQVEGGRRNLTVTVLARLAKALGVTPDRLLVASKAAGSRPKG
jgi:transcriptional regulator with XRE-family HTH domain